MNIFGNFRAISCLLAFFFNGGYLVHSYLFSCGQHCRLSLTNLVSLSHTYYILNLISYFVFTGRSPALTVMRTATLILLASVAMAYGFVQPTRRPYITTVGVPCDKKPRRGPPRCLAVPDPWPKGGLFSPPGFTDDLQTADELKGWSDEINEMMVKSSDPEGRPQFYNPLNIPKAQQEGASTVSCHSSLTLPASGHCSHGAPMALHDFRY
jgi:hypothetical protein